ncbi:hypothetical protein N0B51_10205 [Tsuneonella sp. YG55]|uniref:DUF1611 domain-containing protein n=1 Tax=Tsuneonella litorea TaxID=2976475 RepID=A0A9X3A9Y5_9SPHN|nr:hypothetical protein [Tsuneonella litorea]MCT2559350.1 hypothetical protein [Tsuneonella litorea]
MTPGIYVDERLATALEQPDHLLSSRQTKWRQILDLLVRLGPAVPIEQGREGLAFLQRHHHEIPPHAFAQLRRAYRGRAIADLAVFLRPSADLTGRPANLPTRVPATAPAAIPEPDRPLSLERARESAASAPGPYARSTQSIFRQWSERAPVRATAREIVTTPVEHRRVKAAKAAFTTRNVSLGAVATLVSGAVRPRTGDLVLARVEAIHYHKRIELASGRKATLHAGDEIIVAYGDRYATDQFEAEVPPTLGPTNLIAAGGVASAMLSRTAGVKPASRIVPIGLLGDARGNPLNLRQFALPRLAIPPACPPIVCVLGTSMNSGKTTTIQHLVQGLSRAGLKPGTVKITGTGSGGDYWVMLDAGSHKTLDFTDAGFSSTYRIPVPDLLDAATTLVAHLAEAGCGIILMEVADGLYQEQNVEIIRSDFFRQRIDSVLFAAGEAMGASAGVRELESLGTRVLGVSGKLTASHLLVREASASCHVPVLTKEQLADPFLASALVGRPGLAANDSDLATEDHALRARATDGAVEPG